MTCPTCHMTGLTPRELSVAALVADGLSNSQIAGKLFLAEKTVKNVVSAILAKLGFSNRTHLAIWFIRREVANA